MTYVNDTKIISGYRTDHSIITLQLDFDNFRKGSSYWNINNSLLKDPEYVKLIKEKISQVKQHYIIEEQILSRNIPNKEIVFDIDYQLF